jgi:hypothetical protein
MKAVIAMNMCPTQTYDDVHSIAFKDGFCSILRFSENKEIIIYYPIEKIKYIATSKQADVEKKNII